MWRDLERQCQRLNLPFRKPEIFPINGIHAARVGLIAQDEGWAGEWTRAVFKANFEEGENIGDVEVLKSTFASLEIGESSNGPSRIPTTRGWLSAAQTARIFDLAASDANKLRLKEQTEEAMEKDIFGGPTFGIDGEIFWGDDRLEHSTGARSQCGSL